MSEYRPFITDPTHIALVDGERYVCLRPHGDVVAAHAALQDRVRERLTGLPASYPNAHVTLVGFRRGTTLDEIRDVVGEWASTVGPLHVEAEAATYFPAQIVIVRVRKTPELFDALANLRRLATERGLRIFDEIPDDDWIFHMSVAYCPRLDGASWDGTKTFVDTVNFDAVRCTVEGAEIAAFDDGREHSGGFYAFGVR